MNLQFNLLNSSFQNEDGKKVWKNAFVLNGISYDLVVEVQNEDLADVFLSRDTTQKVAQAWSEVYREFPKSPDLLQISKGMLIQIKAEETSNVLEMNDPLRAVILRAFSCFEEIRII